MSAFPALANVAAQCLFPLAFVVFLHDTGIFDKLDLDVFAQSFPSDGSFRKFAIHQAVRDTITLGNSLSGSKTFIAADKGNKKGVGHFAKLVSTWKREGGVHVQLVDIDAAGGTSEDCAVAIQASMNKLKNPGEENQPTHLALWSYHGLRRRRHS